MAVFVTNFVADCVTDFCIFFVFQVSGEIVLVTQALSIKASSHTRIMKGSS